MQILSYSRQRVIAVLRDEVMCSLKGLKIMWTNTSFLPSLDTFYTWKVNSFFGYWIPFAIKVKFKLLIWLQFPSWDSSAMLKFIQIHIVYSSPTITTVLHSHGTFPVLTSLMPPGFSLISPLLHYPNSCISLVIIYVISINFPRSLSPLPLRHY